MAGDWMKIELELPDKPEVHAIAGMLNIDPDAVVGKLFRIWQWFDKHTTDGNAHGVTYSLPDRIAGVIGFGEAMAFVGWLEQRDKTLVMPNFDRHTSKSAKTRASTAKRVAEHKAKSNALGNAESVSDVLPDALPREEKRRDIKHTPKGAFDPKTYLLEAEVEQSVVDDWLTLRKSKRAAVTLTAIHGIEREAKLAGWTLQQALTACCERGWQGFKAEFVANLKPTPPPTPTLSLDEIKARKKAEADAAKARMREEEAKYIVPPMGLRA